MFFLESSQHPGVLMAVHFRIPPTDDTRTVRLAGTLQAFCAVVFAADVAVELARGINHHDPISGMILLHLTLESAAVLALLTGYMMARRHRKTLLAVTRQQERLLYSLRGHFDEILSQRFQEWDLTPAESDIALLSLRGLKISEVAALRSTREGTIKSQLSAIFRKAGVGTRTELLGLFMDEFLDFAASVPKTD